MVVSLPATSSCCTMRTSSGMSSGSLSEPSSSAPMCDCSNVVSRSSVGSRRRCSNCSTKKCCISTIALVFSTNSSGETVAPMVAVLASDHRLKSACRSIGMLSAWAMTRVGSGTAKSSTNSTDDGSSHASTSSSASATTNGRSCSILRGVNARDTRRRKRLCMGRVVVEQGARAGEPLGGDALDLVADLLGGRGPVGAERRGERGWVVQHSEDVVVAQDQVGVAALDVEHTVGSHGLVVGVRVLLDHRIGEVEAFGCGCHWRMLGRSGRN